MKPMQEKSTSLTNEANERKEILRIMKDDCRLVCRWGALMEMCSIKYRIADVS